MLETLAPLGSHRRDRFLNQAAFATAQSDRLRRQPPPFSENNGNGHGSDGTDHGAAGTAFLIGTRVRGQMIGEFPGVANLDDDGNLRATSDFRGVYCSLLEQWLNEDAAAVIPGAGSFSRPALLK